MSIIRFQPIYKERVWGGRNLEHQLKRSLPKEKKLGESWELVDRLEAQSIVKNGPHKGLTIRKLLETQGHTIMGPTWDARKPFPLLVKWLDCRERLSLQVHPPMKVAQALKGEPKDEAWYIADADEEASLMIGLKQGVTRQQFETALTTHSLEPLIHEVGVKPGDSIFIPSGRLHAIGQGNLILEIQQNSDTTYRVYDWNRVGLDGKPRKLHIEASLQSINFDDKAPSIHPAAPGEQLIAHSHSFRICKFDLNPRDKDPLSFPAHEQPRLLGVVSGQLTLLKENIPLTKGDNVLLPYAEACTLRAIDDAVVLVTDQFV